jgi:hypothetical protein
VRKTCHLSLEDRGDGAGAVLSLLTALLGFAALRLGAPETTCFSSSSACELLTQRTALLATSCELNARCSLPATDEGISMRGRAKTEDGLLRLAKLGELDAVADGGSVRTWRASGWGEQQPLVAYSARLPSTICCWLTGLARAGAVPSPPHLAHAVISLLRASCGSPAFTGKDAGEGVAFLHVTYTAYICLPLLGTCWLLRAWRVAACRRSAPHHHKAASIQHLSSATVRLTYIRHF